MGGVPDKAHFSLGVVTNAYIRCGEKPCDDTLTSLMGSRRNDHFWLLYLSIIAAAMNHFRRLSERMSPAPDEKLLI
jgi:hypothetical protein